MPDTTTIVITLETRDRLEEIKKILRKKTSIPDLDITWNTVVALAAGTYLEKGGEGVDE